MTQLSWGHSYVLSCDGGIPGIETIMIGVNRALHNITQVLCYMYIYVHYQSLSCTKLVLDMYPLYKSHVHLYMFLCSCIHACSCSHVPATPTCIQLQVCIVHVFLNNDPLIMIYLWHKMYMCW